MPVSPPSLSLSSLFLSLVSLSLSFPPLSYPFISLSFLILSLVPLSLSPWHATPSRASFVFSPPPLTFLHLEFYIPEFEDTATYLFWYFFYKQVYRK